MIGSPKSTPIISLNSIVKSESIANDDVTVYVATTDPEEYVDPITKSTPIGVALGVTVGVTDCVGVIVYVGVTDCVGVIECVGVNVNVGVTDCVGVTVYVGVTDCVGVGVGVNNDNAIEFAALTYTCTAC